jgi:dienelactone hydrolase
MLRIFIAALAIGFLSTTDSLAQDRVGERFKVAVDGDAGRVEIDVWLSLPSGSGRAPAMLIMHSSGGLHARDWENAHSLNSAGVATAVVDSFGPRDLQNVWQNKQSFTAWSMSGDGLAALRWLASNPRIDTARIGSMGRSLGGEATIHLALAKARKLRANARTAPTLALAVPIYPGCIGQWRDAGLTPGTQLHFLLAANDDLTPAAHCVEYSQRMRSAGATVTVFTFDNAFHSFDVVSQAVFSDRQENYSKCRNEWRDANDHVRLDTGAQIAGRERLARYLSECKSMGGWVGGNPTAAKELNGKIVDLAVSRLLRRP